MSNVFAVDMSIEGSGTMTHYILKNGLRLESVYESEEGTATFGIEWDNLTKAEANYQNAREGALVRLTQVRARISEMDGQTEKQKVRYLLKTERGSVVLYTNTGPPAWWLPKLSLAKDYPGIRGGWLYGAFQLYWDKKEDLDGC